MKRPNRMWGDLVERLKISVSDQTVQGTAGKERTQVFPGRREKPHPCLLRGPGDVRGYPAPGMTEQGVVRGRGLRAQHVQPGSGDPARIQGLEERLLIDESAPRGVDEIGSGLHPADGPGVDHLRRFPEKGTVE